LALVALILSALAAGSAVVLSKHWRVAHVSQSSSG
jgi:hypothetical protein